MKNELDGKRYELQIDRFECTLHIHHTRLIYKTKNFSTFYEGQYIVLDLDFEQKLYVVGLKSDVFIIYFMKQTIKQ